MVERFSDDEPGYAAWLAAHPDGFVFNHFGGHHAAYNVIHQASCRHLHRAVDSGRRTVIEKLVSTDLRELTSRVNQVRGLGAWKFCNGCCEGGER